MPKCEICNKWPQQYTIITPLVGDKNNYSDGGKKSSNDTIRRSKSDIYPLKKSIKTERVCCFCYHKYQNYIQSF